MIEKEIGGFVSIREVRRVSERHAFSTHSARSDTNVQNVTFLSLC